MRNTILILITLFAFTGCKKEEQEIFVKGRIMNISDSTAFANTSFVLYESSSNNATSAKVKETVQSFTTDANGYFGVNFKPQSSSGIKLFWPNDNYYQDNARAVASKNGNTTDFGTVYISKY